MTERRRPWYKSPTRAKRPLAYFRLVQPARATWNSLWDLAGLSDVFDGGVREGSRPLDISEIAGDTGLTLSQQAAAMKTLLGTGIVETRDGVYFVPAFLKAQQRDQTANERKRKQRARDNIFDSAAGQNDGSLSEDHGADDPSGVTQLLESHAERHAHGVLEDREDLERGSLFLPPASPPVEKQSPPASGRPMRLGLDIAEKAAAGEILGAIWKRVAASVGRSMTRTQWGRINSKVARDMVLAGATLDEVLAAHDSISEKFGAPVRMLAKVQEELANISARSGAKPRAAAHPPSYNATSTFRDYGDAPFDDEVIA